MIWTIGKATDDVLAIIEETRKTSIYVIKEKEVIVKEIKIINMSEDKEYFIFTLSITLSEAMLVEFIDGRFQQRGVVIKNLKYRKVKEKTIADWNDD